MYTIMPSYKRLGEQEVNKMKSMVKAGTAPEDIAKYFEIGISTVHNYKKKFKQEGLDFPDVRGQRPTGQVKTVTRGEAPTVKGEVVPRTGSRSAGTNRQSPGDAAAMRLMINNIWVEIGSDYIEIESGLKNICFEESVTRIEF